MGLDQVLCQTYAVINRTGGAWDIETGAGLEVADGSDKVTFMLVLSGDLTS